ncbi:MAG: diguanylate cyclase [Marinicellaceae bacterium]
MEFSLKRVYFLASQIVYINEMQVNQNKIILVLLLILTTVMSPTTLLAQSISTYQANIDQCKSLEDDRPKEAIEFARKTLVELNPETQPEAYGHILGCLGWALAMNNQQNQSRIQAIELENLTNSLTESKEKSSLYMRAGGVYHLLGDRISASTNYKNAFNVAENLQLRKELIPILVNLGVLNSELKEHNAAIDNYNYALELMTEINDFRYKPPVLFNLALTLNGQKMYDEGLGMFLQIEKMIDENWPKNRVSQVYSGLASSYIGLNDYSNALIYNNKTLDIQKEISFQDSVRMTTEAAQAKILQELGQSKLSKKYADKVYQYYMSNDDQKGLIFGNNGINILVNVYENTGELDKVVNLYKISLELNNTFQESFNKESIAQMQARLINSQQREELLDLKHSNAIEKLKTQQQQEKNKQKQIKNERELLFISLFVLILVLFLIWLRVLNMRLKKLTLRDSLTKLSNRRALKIWLDRNPLNNNSQRKLWMLDLDNFKKINDQYGHDKGDLVLIAVSKFLKTLKCQQNFIGRWGGEEFILITDDISDTEIHQFANSILNNISKLTIDQENPELKITASMGIAIVNAQSKRNWETSLNQADNAMYQAKNNGRNCYVIHS